MPLMFDDLFDDRRDLEFDFPIREMTLDLAQLAYVADVIAFTVLLADGVGKLVTKPGENLNGPSTETL